jgi:hypothetical protein
MLSLHHELGWVIDFQDVIDSLWAGDILPKFSHDNELTVGYRRLIGYIDHGKEVLFDEQPARLHVS